jgi:DNA primase
MIATLPSPVEREIYGNRAAATAGVSGQTMAAEVEKARKGQSRKVRRQEERQALMPTNNFQPKERQLRYDNVRSARAEEGVLRLLLLDPALYPRAQGLEEEQFSSPFLGKVYRLLFQRWQAGETPRIPMLTGELSLEEMNRLVQLADWPETGQNTEKALADYIEIIRGEWSKRSADGVEKALLAVREQKRKKAMEDIRHE